MTTQQGALQEVQMETLNNDVDFGRENNGNVSGTSIRQQWVTPVDSQPGSAPHQIQDVGTTSSEEYAGARGPRQPTMPVETQPFSVPLQQVPYPRSLEEELAQFNFDQASWSVLHNLEAQRGSNSQAVSLVHGGLKNVIATAGNFRPESLESCDEKYRKLIEGVLRSGEGLTGNPFFEFGKVQFQHILDTSHGVTAQAKPDMTPGRIYLTNQRLLLLSVGDTAGLQLIDNANTIGVIGAQPKTGVSTKIFSVTGSKTSTCRYESISLADIRGVDMSSVFSGTSATNIKGIIPESSCWSCCCPVEEIWEGLPLTSSTNLVGVINVGVLLPPWQTKCNVLIYMPTNRETTAAVGFIWALQHAAPALKTSTA